MPNGISSLYGKLGRVEDRLTRLEDEVKHLRKDYNEDRRGMSRGEKIAFSSAVAALVVAATAVAALLGGPA